MTRDEVRAATTEAATAARALADHLERLRGRMQPWFPVDEIALAGWNDDRRERLHAMLRMYDQLFDLTTRKLFRGLLFLSGETIAGLSAQNQFRRVEALGGPDADRWIELGVTRNILAHDYPTNPVAQAQRANRAWTDLIALIDGTRRTLALMHSEGILS